MPSKDPSNSEPKYTLIFIASIQDAGYYQLKDQDENQIGNIVKDYIPDFIPNKFGDVFELHINLETGQILNWPKHNLSKILSWFNQSPHGMKIEEANQDIEEKLKRKWRPDLFGE